MEMNWILILFIWFVAPFGELAVIIGLLVSNDRYKRRVQELEMARLRPVLTGSNERWRTEPEGQRPTEAVGEPENGTPAETVREPENGTMAETVREPEGQMPGKGEPETGVTGKTVMEPDREVPGAAQKRDVEPPEETPERQGTQPRKESPGQENSAGEWAARQRVPEPVLSGSGEWTESKTLRIPARPGKSAGLGILSLILGVIFIVLAGLIFATTTWHVLPDTGKVFLVLACSALFFGVSLMAEKLFHIHKTSNAFYVLGSAFLFLTVVAAAYFKLLGPGFILDRENRWKVLWVGSLVLEISFFTGLKRFHDRLYTQVSLWGLSVSMFFLAKAFSMTWGGFVSMMSLYASFLIIIRKFLENPGHEGQGDLKKILAEGIRSFAPIQFWFFCGIAVIRGLFAEGRMLAEVCTGETCWFLDKVSVFRFTLPGMAAMAALMTGLWFSRRERQELPCSRLFRGMTVETAVYMAGLVSDNTTGRMLTVNLILLGIHMPRHWRERRENEEASLFWDISGCLAMVITAVGFCADPDPGWAGLMCCLGAFLGYYLWFYRGSRQWPHLLAAISMVPVPLAAWYRLGLTFDQLGFGVAGVLLISGIAARHFHPILEEDHRVEGGWRADWFQILSVFVLLAMAVMGDDRWRFAYTLLAALHFYQYKTVKTLRKPALSISACLLAGAFWQQPFISWPQILELEISLIPVVWLIWTVGAVWGKNPWLKVTQTLGYLICLFLLCQDAFRSGLVTDALILEGICLTIFMGAIIKKNPLWTRISVSLMLLVVIFLTRDFWLSLSWWVYLLAAGATFLLFAAVLEKKERL